jgi:hypothetical protein
MSEPAPEPDDRPTRPRAVRRPTELALVPVGAETTVPEPPVGAVLHPQAPADPARRGWLLAQLWAEIALVPRMYLDARYRVSRTAQLLVPAILVAFVLNYFLFAFWFAVPVLSPILERLLDVVLGITLYKLVTRELARYREVLDYLTRYGTS